MSIIDATNLDHKTINQKIREAEYDCEIVGCLGQRFIAAGASQKRIVIKGIPGNALGAYLNGAYIETLGNAQDATGDTMNDGTIVTRGDIGDATGYAMRGGRIFVQGNAGYRAGVHMKAYKDKKPLIVVGGRAGAFLGEYQAGGAIVVLGLNADAKKIVGNFPCAGMHGGKLFLRTDGRGLRFPSQVSARSLNDEDRVELVGYIDEYCRFFNANLDDIWNAPFIVVTPNVSNPYRRMYAPN